MAAERPAGHAVETLRSNGERCFFVAMGLAGVAGFAGTAVGLVAPSAPAGPFDGLIWLALAAVSLVVVLEGIRASLVVDSSADRAGGSIVVQRAVRRQVVPAAAVDAIVVPSRGPMMLRVRDGAGVAYVRTGVYADPRGAQGRAVTLAARLDVPMISSRRGVQPDFVWPAPPDDPVRGVRWDLFRTPGGVVIWLGTATCLSTLAVLIIVTLHGA
jgi:hypothetical protein